LDLGKLYPYLEKATHALAELNSLHKSVPNTTLFLYMYVRQEALFSSQIEGTQSSLSDLMLFENDQKPTVAVEDVEEVSNYVKALNYGLQRLKDFPLSLRLLREVHGILLSGGRGSGKLPGEFRRSQNWIGGTRPGNALFVPPSVDQLDGCLSDFEKFLHDTSLPVLIKTGLVHLQFETIHPFLDGNGRLGRLLITLLLCHDGMLDSPILYLSLYFKRKRHRYYELLQEVRLHGTWEAWLEFFLEAVSHSAKEAMHAIYRINRLLERHQAELKSLGRAMFSCEQVLKYMTKLPQVTVPLLVSHLGMTAPTARNALNSMVKLNILKEISGKKRDKIYVYHDYLAIFEEDMFLDRIKKDFFEKPCSIVELQQKAGNDSGFWTKFNNHFEEPLDKSAEDMRKYFNEEFFPLLQYLSSLEDSSNITVQLQQPGTPNYDAILYKNDEEFECVQVTLARDKQNNEFITDILAAVDMPKIAEYQNALKNENDTARRAELNKKIRQAQSMNKGLGQLEMHVNDNIRPREVSLIREAISKKISKQNLKPNPLSVLIVVYRAKDFCYQSSEILNLEEQRELRDFCLKESVFSYYPKVCLVHYRGTECRPDKIHPIIFSEETGYTQCS